MRLLRGDGPQGYLIECKQRLSDGLLPCLIQTGPVSALIGCPISVRVVASFSMLFDTQIKGRMGSPSVAGSTRRLRAGTSPGSFSERARRPPPARRTCPFFGSGSASRSTAPATRTSIAANKRRRRSSSFERPATPMSYAGVARRTTRRAYGAAAYGAPVVAPGYAAPGGCRLRNGPSNGAPSDCRRRLRFEPNSADPSRSFPAPRVLLVVIGRRSASASASPSRGPGNGSRYRAGSLIGACCI